MSLLLSERQKESEEKLLYTCAVLDMQAMHVGIKIMEKGQTLDLREDNQQCPQTESAIKGLNRRKSRDQESRKQRSQVRLLPVQKAQGRDYRQITERMVKTECKVISKSFRKQQYNRIPKRRMRKKQRYVRKTLFS